MPAGRYTVRMIQQGTLAGGPIDGTTRAAHRVNRLQRTREDHFLGSGFGVRNSVFPFSASAAPSPLRGTSTTARCQEVQKVRTLAQPPPTSL
jgi:hypothetical protein